MLSWVVGIHKCTARSREQTDRQISPVEIVSGSFRGRGHVPGQQTLYPGTCHLPLDTSCDVRSSISGFAATISSWVTPLNQHCISFSRAFRHVPRSDRQMAWPLQCSSTSSLIPSTLHLPCPSSPLHFSQLASQTLRLPLVACLHHMSRV